MGRRAECETDGVGGWGLGACSSTLSAVAGGQGEGPHTGPKGRESMC